MASVAKRHFPMTTWLALATAFAWPAAAFAQPVSPPVPPKHHEAGHHTPAHTKPEEKPEPATTAPPHAAQTHHAETHHETAKAPPAAKLVTPRAGPPKLVGPRPAVPKPVAPEAATPNEPPPPAAAAVAPPPPPADKGTVTGLPLPRFASLRSDEVNLRSGPGTRYPIDWVYQRRDLPVEIEREFEVWRLIEDPEGTKGWVHQATLTGRRGLVVVGLERTLHTTADALSPAVAKLMPGVIGRIMKCDTGVWCQVQVGDYRGWLQRGEFWGTLPAEVIQ